MINLASLSGMIRRPASRASLSGQAGTGGERRDSLRPGRGSLRLRGQAESLGQLEGPPDSDSDSDVRVGCPFFFFYRSSWPNVGTFDPGLSRAAGGRAAGPGSASPGPPGPGRRLPSAGACRGKSHGHWHWHWLSLDHASYSDHDEVTEVVACRFRHARRPGAQCRVPL
jgi:hypothetical protein